MPTAINLDSPEALADRRLVAAHAEQTPIIRPRHSAGIRGGQRRTWLAIYSEAESRPSPAFEVKPSIASPKSATITDGIGYGSTSVSFRTQGSGLVVVTTITHGINWKRETLSRPDAICLYRKLMKQGFENW